MEEKISITGLLPAEICSALEIKPAFRGKQIFSWVSKGAVSFDAMTNLDKTTRAALSEKACIYTSKVSKALHDPDGTIKLQITLKDSRAIETVLLTDREGRKTACVSCQAGISSKSIYFSDYLSFSNTAYSRIARHLGK